MHTCCKSMHGRSMAHHQQNLLDFSSSSSSPPAMAPFHHHADTMPWPPPAAAGGGSAVAVVGGHERLPPYYTAPPPTMMQPLLLQSSRYLGPARELLAELCSLADHAGGGGRSTTKGGGQWDVEANYSASWEDSNPGGLLSSMDLLALQRRKARLLSMVQEVDRRYRRYREQMRATELSFEAVAGAGAAQVYTKLAMRAMSRHFRSLRDALVGQVSALRKAMGEGDIGSGGVSAMPGASRGDTPRLRVLDHCLRQQRAFQQSGGATESYPWRPQRGLPERAVAVLRSWLFEHFLHPYPNDVDKHILVRQTGLSRSQVSNWFINARVRLWKPMIEEMYADEETKQPGANGGGGGKPVVDDRYGNTAAAWSTTGEIRDASSCFVSAPIIPAAGDDGQQLFHGYLSSHGGGGRAASVSLTLGLQQRQQQQPATMMIMQQLSSAVMLGGAGDQEEEDVVLPYRNLMGSSELLHDLADPAVYN